jgi:hypothetical protein
MSAFRGNPEDKSNRDAGLLLLVGLLIDAALSNVSA